MKLLYSFAHFYNNSFQTRPVATLAVTNGILSGVADVVVRPSASSSR